MPSTGGLAAGGSSSKPLRSTCTVALRCRVPLPAAPELEPEERDSEGAGSEGKPRCSPSAATATSARKARKDWMTCGVYGVVQFVRHPVQQTAVADAVVNQADPFADSHELQKVLVAIANACAEISERVAAQPTLSPSERGYTGETNESGDVQKKLDVFCDDVFEKHLIERLHNNERLSLIHI